MTSENAPVPAEELLRHRAWVRSLARSLVDDEWTVDELEQETWVAALRSPPRSAAAATTWIARVVRGRAIDLIRSRSRREVREIAAARAESTPSAADTVARAETHRLVVEAVMALEEPYRTAVLLRFFDDLPPREVARRTGVPVETARTHIRRGVERLRDRLAPERDDRMRGALLALVWETRHAPRVAAGGAAAAGGATLMAIGAKQVVVAALVVAVLAGGYYAVRGAGRDDVRPSSSGGGATGAQVPAAARARADRPRTDAPPPADAAAAAQSPAAVTRLIRVRREDGGSVEGLLAVLCDERDVAFRGRLPADGRIDAPASARERALVVAGGGLVAQRVLVPAGTGETDAVVPAGATVAGRVLVDGAAPREPMEISLWLEEAGVALALVPMAARSGDGPDVIDLFGATTRTGPGGTFTFGGIPPGARGHLAGQWGWVPAPANAETTFRAPRDDVVLRLHRLPRLTGRVVRGASREAVAEAGAVARWSDAASAGSDSTKSDLTGRFSLVLSREGVGRVVLRIVGAGGLASGEIEVAGPFTGDRDLGDIVVPDPWERTMRVALTDAAGHPVDRAVAVVAEDQAWVVPRPGADGIVVLPAAGGARTAWIAAPGFRPHAVAIESTGGSTSPVVLERAATLRLRVVGPAGPVRGAVVRVSAAPRLLEDADWTAREMLRTEVGGTPANGAERSDDAESCSYRLDDAQEVVVPWVLPGVDVRVAAADSLGEPLAAQLVRLDPGEDRTVAMRTGLVARQARFVVRDERGNPICDARVIACSSAALSDEGSPLESADTGTDGRALLGSVHAPSVAVLVEARGFATYFRRAVAVPETAADVPLVLGRGATLVVRTLGRDGAAVTCPEAWAEVDDPEFWAPPRIAWQTRPRDDGALAIEGLPPGEVTVVVVGPDGAETRTRTDSRRGTLDVTLRSSNEEK
jgi:RNA polymerase sigma-70 factor (ECF subfamily)